MNQRFRAPIIRADRLALQGDGGEMRVLPTSLQVHEGLTAIVGPSGSGKTSLLLLLSGLVPPTTGEVRHIGLGNFEEKPFTSAPANERWLAAVHRAVLLGTKEDERRSAYRAKYLGHIFQAPYIPREYTAEESIRLPHQTRGNQIDEAYLNYLVDGLDMRPHLAKRSTELSGGELQRATIIGALAHRPQLVTADEPTASLDSDLTARTFELFREITDSGDTSIVMTSHSQQAAGYADDTISMRDGQVINSSVIR